MTQRTLLILSFTDIAADARVKKQALLFADEYRVVTCGYGEAVRDDIEHIQLSTGVTAGAGARRYLEPFWVRSHAYRLAFHADLRTQHAIAALAGRQFDAVVANELETLPVAYAVSDPGRVLLDLHEYYPGLRDDLPVWVRVRKPYQQWLLRNRASRAGAVTTVSGTIAERYEAEFGLSCGVVWNAAPLRPELTTQPAHTPIRLVHSGVAAENRRPEVMMRAAARTRANVTLDMYLTQQHSEFGQKLLALATELGPRVTIHPPVLNAELVETLNEYDVGVHILAPTNTNNELALPNKFFDFVQARLGMIIGPTADMAKLLRSYDLGAVADGFDEAAVTEVFDRLDEADIKRWKANAAEAAAELSADQQHGVWLRAVEGILV